jgi:ketosteroid isomerase-like protein
MGSDHVSRCSRTEPVIDMEVPIIVQRLQQAINEHDLEAIADCFDPNYESEQPAHPGRSFRGREQLRTNWTQILGGIPDLHAELRRWAASGDEVWTEWEWQGTRRDGSPSVMRGITIQGLRDEVIAWVRFYMEPVEEAGGDVDAAIAEQVKERRSA